MKQLIQRMAWCLVITSFCTFSQAGVIDFESTAGGATPNDNSLIGLNDRFNASGVFVRFGNNANVFLEQTIFSSYSVFKETWAVEVLLSGTEQLIIRAFDSDALLPSFKLSLVELEKSGGANINRKMARVDFTFDELNSAALDSIGARPYNPEPESIILFIAGILGIASSVFDKRFFRAIRYILKLK